LYVSGAHHVEISHNDLSGGTMSAIYVGDPGEPSSDVQILGNRISRNGTHWNLDHGIYVGTDTGGLIANNVIADNMADGIQIYPEANSLIVTENTITGNGRSGIILGGEDTTSNDNVLANNIVAFNDEYGIRTYWGGPVGTDNLATNNLNYGNGGGDAPGSVLDGLRITAGRSADPLFADAARFDFHLRAGSPAIGQGLAAYAVTTDFDGLARPSAPAIGAYEAQAGSVRPTARTSSRRPKGKARSSAGMRRAKACRPKACARRNHAATSPL
jgi:hypothetical protein